ncbi:MAG: hypothetical protein ACYTE8_08395 [Planctomycetota bacterium]
MAPLQSPDDDRASWPSPSSKVHLAMGFFDAATALAGAPPETESKARLARSSLSLNGLPISTLAVKGPFTFKGSRHESEHVPPHPYSNVKSRA